MSKTVFVTNLFNGDKEVVGNNDEPGVITSNGAQNLKLTTNNDINSGSITITDGANENITIAPNGTGSVNINADGATTTNALNISADGLTTGSALDISCTNATNNTRSLISHTSATDTVTATGTLVTTYPSHTSCNGIQEGWIKMVWTATLTDAAHTSQVRLPEGNTFITQVMVVTTTAPGGGETADLGLTGDPDGILDAVSLNAAGLQSDYTDLIRGAYAANSGDNDQVHWHIPDSVTGADRALVLTLSALGTAGHILIKYVNIVA